MNQSKSEKLAETLDRIESLLSEGKTLTAAEAARVLALNVPEVAKEARQLRRSILKGASEKYASWARGFFAPLKAYGETVELG